jgi:RNA polymerase sigma-70 factor (ECF subfamily)
MDADRLLIEGCLKRDPKAQEAMYRRFSPKMYGVCLRFAGNKMEAEDILQEGFIKIFTHLQDYQFKGSMEGWIRKAMINTAINYYRKKSKELADINLEQVSGISYIEEDAIDKLAAEELVKLIQKLPEGYRLIFNLNVIEGFTHKEIGEMLGISENTSKSQLSRAKSALQEMIIQRK